MVQAVIEPSKDGYGLYFNTASLEGITSFGVTLKEVKNNASVVLKEMAEIYDENNEPLPEALQEVDLNDLRFKFSFDLRFYFEHYSYLNLSEFAKKIHINPSLLRQYKKGLAFSSEKQFESIRKGLHLIAKELEAAM